MLTGPCLSPQRLVPASIHCSVGATVRDSWLSSRGPRLGVWLTLAALLNGHQLHSQKRTRAPPLAAVPVCSEYALLPCTQHLRQTKAEDTD